MSAFQAYAGSYEFAGQSFDWRCYATVRVHGVRRLEHTPLPKPPAGRKWIWESPIHDEPEIAWLVDEAARDFSHILLQIQPQPVAATRFAEAV